MKPTYPVFDTSIDPPEELPFFMNAHARRTLDTAREHGLPAALAHHVAERVTSFNYDCLLVLSRIADDRGPVLPSFMPEALA